LSGGGVGALSEKCLGLTDGRAVKSDKATIHLADWIFEFGKLWAEKGVPAGLEMHSHFEDSLPGLKPGACSANESIEEEISIGSGRFVGKPEFGKEFVGVYRTIVGDEIEGEENILEILLTGREEEGPHEVVDGI
jgi:hypothetical protein